MEYADTDPLPRLYISLDTDGDWLTALEFGRTDDGLPAENWGPVGERFAYIHMGDAEEMPAVGFRVRGLSEFDADGEDVAEIWDAPRFDAPQLGLTAATAGEIVLAVRGTYGLERPSINRHMFSVAIEREGAPAANGWIACLHAGDPMAHYGLGYTLLDLGYEHDAYRHLRYYAEIAPAQPWAYNYHGQAAEAIGEVAEAEAAYERALELTAEGGVDTDAEKRLARLRR